MYKNKSLRGVDSTTKYLSSAIIVITGYMSAPIVASDLALEEVVVTAEKREASLQRTPISISAFTADFIDNERLESVEDISRITPGLSIGGITASNQNISIRGQSGDDDAPSLDKAVAIFIDDVYINGPEEFNLDFFDIERIEVLRGPQGTLFGRNIVGGAINVISRKPTHETFGMFQATGGNHGRIDAKGILSGSLVEDKVAGKISFSSRKSDGHIENTVTGNKLGGEEITSYRGQLLLNLAEDIEVVISADYTKDSSDGGHFSYWVEDDSNAPALIAPLSYDETKADQDIDGKVDREIAGLVGRVDWDILSGTLTSISAYRKLDSMVVTDIDATPSPILHLSEFTNNELFTQELRFASNGSDTLSWIGGIYFLHNEKERFEILDWDTATGSFLDTGIVLPGPIVIIEGMGDDPFTTTRSQDVTTESVAVFGELRYEITENMSVVLGGRYTYDKKEGTTDRTGKAEFVTGEPYSVDFSDNWKEFTPRAILEYSWNEDIFSYFSISRGFKSGGFTMQAKDAQTAVDGFDPEYVTSYELGIKSRLLNDRLQVNVAIFQADTTDLQVQTYDENINIVLENVGESRVRGFELDAVAIATENMKVTANYAYYDGKYIEYESQLGDFSGNRMPGVANNNLSLSGEYTWALESGGRLTARADYQYKGKTYPTPENDTIPEILDMSEIKESLNARLTYETSDDQWKFTLWGRNILNESYVGGSIDLGVLFYSLLEQGIGKKIYRQQYASPRTYGMTITRRFW